MVTWALPSGNTSFHGFPANFDADGDGWNDVIDTPVDNFNRSVFIYSGKTGQMLKEIISPTGQKLMYPRAAKYLVGTSSQLAFNVVVPVTATGGNMGSSLMIYNSDGTKAGEFSSQDFFDSFAGLSPKPACWSGCLNPNYISLATPDLDGDGFNDFIGSSFALFSLKSKTGQLYMATTPYYFLNSLSVSPYFFR